MGQGTTGVNDSPEQLEREVQVIRQNLTDVVRELDHRRHDLLDWRLHVRRHPKEIDAIAGGLLLLMGGLAVLEIWRRRRNQMPLMKARRLKQVLSRLADSPERIARPPPYAANNALMAAASAVAGVLGKTFAEHWLAPLRQ